MCMPQIFWLKPIFLQPLAKAKDCVNVDNSKNCTIYCFIKCVLNHKIISAWWITKNHKHPALNKHTCANMAYKIANTQSLDCMDVLNSNFPPSLPKI
jgi:hypothetical protein